MSNMNLELNISQKQVLSQHMVQSMEILQMSAQELEGYIENLALENPVIELPDTFSSSARDDSSATQLQRKMEWLESTDQQNKVYYRQERDDENSENNWHDARASQETLSDYLLSQLLLADYNDSERAIVDFLIQSLDSRGYLSDSISSISDHLNVPEDTILRLLGDIQKLDPAGVGARDLKECLLIQVKRLDIASDTVSILIEEHLDDIAKNHIQDIAKKMHISIEDVLNACDIIRSLNPKPGSSFSDRENLKYISPDAVVIKLEDSFEILVNEYQYPSLSINSYYQNMLKTTTDSEAKKYLQEKISQAQWVSNCISQRSSTLARVMNALVQEQNEFFLLGPGHKKPLRLADLASILDLHESTISRTMRGKYLQCTWGVFPLNYFLTSVAATSSSDGGEKTPEQIQGMIRQLIDTEDKKKPYSDQAICSKLNEQGIEISRRTVNKYRTAMGIPDKSGRKSWE